MYRRNSKNSKKTLKIQKVRHSKDNTLSESELLQLISATEEDNYFDKVIIILAGYHGMREGEIAHMEKTWIDFQKGTIKIPPEKKCSCYECVQRKRKIAKEDGMTKEQISKITTGIWLPKTKKGARTIPIRQDKDVVNITLEKYFNYYRRVGCSRQTIYQHISDVAKKSGIVKKIHPHALRATAATLWGLKGITAGTLCYFMGWENIETANTYVRVEEESALQEARWRLGLSGGF